MNKAIKTTGFKKVEDRELPIVGCNEKERLFLEAESGDHQRSRFGCYKIEPFAPGMETYGDTFKGQPIDELCDRWNAGELFAEIIENFG